MHRSGTVARTCFLSSWRACRTNDSSAAAGSARRGNDVAAVHGRKRYNAICYLHEPLPFRISDPKLIFMRAVGYFVNSEGTIAAERVGPQHRGQMEHGVEMRILFNHHTMNVEAAQKCSECQPTHACSYYDHTHLRVTVGWEPMLSVGERRRALKLLGYYFLKKIF